MDLDDDTAHTPHEVSWTLVRSQQLTVQDAVDKLLEAPTKARLDTARSALFDYLRIEDRWLDAIGRLVPEWSDQLERGNERLWQAYDAIAWDVPSTLALWQAIKQLRHSLLQQMRVTDRVVSVAGLAWNTRHNIAATAGIRARF